MASAEQQRWMDDDREEEVGEDIEDYEDDEEAEEAGQVDIFSPMYTDLHLCDEGLSSIPSRYLAPCPGLYHPAAVVRLDLSRNNIIELQGIAIFANLVSLDVSNNGLTQLPEDIACCTKLRAIAARNNLLEDVPKSVQYLTQLETLNLSGNRISEFPEVVLSIPTLKALYLGANAIESIPYAIGNMFNLNILYMGGNILKDIPATIGCLENLVNLTLCDNQLETIPATVAELQNLECLSLHNNMIKTLPTEIVRLRNLQQLSLRNNPLVHHFVQNMSFDPPTLKELSARIVRRKYEITRLPGVVPAEIIQYLNSASQCVNPKCKGVYFEACVEHVKFVDFCGKYRVPLLQFLCSGKCARRASSANFSDYSSSSDEEEGETEQNDDARIRKVLLG